jgi:hypothetical protein
MSLLHVYAVCPSQCCVFKSMQHRHEHGRWTRSYVMDNDTQLDRNMQHGQVHAVRPCSCPWCMSVSMFILHVTMHACFLLTIY